MHNISAKLQTNNVEKQTYVKSANDVTKVVNHSMVKFRYGHWSLSYCQFATDTLRRVIPSRCTLFSTILESTRGYFDSCSMSAQSKR